MKRSSRVKRNALARALRPRNPVSLAARQRAAGPHGPTRKALRQQAKRHLKKLLDET